MAGADLKDHYLTRAEAELTLGDEAGDRRAAWAHFQLAGRYLDLAYGSEAERERAAAGLAADTLN